ncbi:MAG: 1-acyl-sn-glycerol-3-phosphate acyltransferase [Dysgonamonadaceae bacterium]|nr:1-acyl-sn-glycerol-3-phosphate acyltransferase [Dysgonamonadaceae bacterium]
MRHVKNAFLFLYQVLIFIPVFVLLTILTAITVMIMSPIFGNKIWGYHPPKWWSRLTCYLALCRVKRRKLGRLNPNQSYVFVGNHQGAFDIFLVYGFLNQNIKWVQKQSLRKLPFVGKASEIAGHVFVDNSSVAARKRTIEKAEEEVTNGVSIMMFPEGSRSKTGKLDKFKRGAYLIALDMKLPIVPLTLNGPFDVLKIHAALIQPGKLELIIHEPIPTDGLTEKDIPALMEQTKETIHSALWDKYQ